MSGSSTGADVWISEYISSTEIYVHGITRVLVHRQTAFQEMLIADVGAQGRALVLDGKWQSCTVDEFLYHCDGELRFYFAPEDERGAIHVFVHPTPLGRTMSRRC